MIVKLARLFLHKLISRLLKFVGNLENVTFSTTLIHYKYYTSTCLEQMRTTVGKHRVVTATVRSTLWQPCVWQDEVPGCRMLTSPRDVTLVKEFQPQNSSSKSPLPKFLIWLLISITSFWNGGRHLFSFLCRCPKTHLILDLRTVYVSKPRL
jgi:hypothetical protein